MIHPFIEDAKGSLCCPYIVLHSPVSKLYGINAKLLLLDIHTPPVRKTTNLCLNQLTA